MFIEVLRETVRGLLKLRYRIRLAGLDDVAARGTSGILFLPNHPALIDPIIVMATLHRRFRAHALADAKQVDRPVVRTLARKAGAIPMADPALLGSASREDVKKAIGECIAALKRGENVLMYPSGHTLRRRLEDLAGNSAVETILREAPEIRVVLVRTRGLWGSSFGRASGQPPQLGKALWRGVRALLANGIFFGPRREVSIELVEPADVPRTADRHTLNRYLEAFYNQDAPPNTYVPYTIWERGGTRTLPEPEAAQGPASAEDIPVATRDLVMRHLREVTGKKTIAEEDQLSRDLGLDSLAIVDLAVWAESEFGFPVGDGAGVTTVRDLLLVARGQAVAAGPVELKPVPAAWFRGGTPDRAVLPEGARLTEVLLGQIRRHPGLVIMADQTAGARTYRDLVTAILVLKPEIEKLPGDYVGIMLPASVAAATVYAAALFAGKIPVMVNWTVGTRNLTHSLDLLGVQRVLTAGRVIQKVESQAGGFGPLKERFVLLEEVATAAGRARKLAAWLRSRLDATGFLRPPPGPSDTAVVLFTSGSESLPKAVPLTHANLIANLRDLSRVVTFRENDRLIGLLPPFHSFGLTATVLLPLCGGVPVVYHPNPTEGSVLAKIIEAYKVTALVGTPTFLNGILRTVRGKEADSLRLVVSGAEKCPEQLYDLVRRLWPKINLLEGYGITECSPVVSLNDESAPRAGTIGKALPSVEYALQDVDTGRRSEPGRPGILLVRGPSIFGGYLKYDGPSPFVEFEGKQWYRTGDIVSESADGVFTFAGRLKRFVKLGGEMISLPAIEDVLLRHYVRASDDEPVLAVEGTPVELNPELVLFTVRPVDREEANSLIRAAGLSPLHNIRLVIKVDKIPTLGTGKTDYRALKERLKKKEK